MGRGIDGGSDFGTVDRYSGYVWPRRFVKEILGGPIKLLHESIVGIYATYGSDVLDYRHEYRRIMFVDRTLLQGGGEK